MHPTPSRGGLNGAQMQISHKRPCALLTSTATSATSKTTRASFRASSMTMHYAFALKSTALNFNLRRNPRHQAQHMVPCPASGQQDPESAADDALDRLLARAALLSFFASQNRSLFAAKCMIETLIEGYREGVSLNEVKTAIPIFLFETTTRMEPVDQDLVVAWCSIIMIMLDTVGVPLYSRGEERRHRKQGQQLGEASEDSDGAAAGVRGFANQFLDQYLSGTNLVRLQLQQNMQNGSFVPEDPQAAGVSPGIRVMQQTSQLAILTLEVIRDLGLPTVTRLNPTPAPDSFDASDYSAGESSQDEDFEADNSGDTEEESAPSTSSGAVGPPGSGVFLQPIGFVSSFFGPLSKQGMQSDGETSSAMEMRAAAVRVLIGFVGASLGHSLNAVDFVEQLTLCYRRGWTAEQLFGQLQKEELAQVGGISQTGVANVPGGYLSTALFARWVSIVYMTLAYQGASFPGANTKMGWAWIGLPDTEDEGIDTAAEAHKVAEFVLQTLTALREQEAAASGSKVEEEQPPLPGFEDPDLGRSSSFALMMKQQMSLVQLTRNMVPQQEVAHQDA